MSDISLHIDPDYLQWPTWRDGESDRVALGIWGRARVVACVIRYCGTNRQPEEVLMRSQYRMVTVERSDGESESDGDHESESDGDHESESDGDGSWDVIAGVAEKVLGHCGIGSGHP